MIYTVMRTRNFHSLLDLKPKPAKKFYPTLNFGQNISLIETSNLYMVVKPECKLKSKDN